MAVLDPELPVLLRCDEPPIRGLRARHAHPVPGDTPMASVIPHPRFAPAPSLPAACCLNQAHDAHRLAQTLATVATPGTILDIGCGSGSVAIPVLLAPDLHAVGVEVLSPPKPPSPGTVQRQPRVATGSSSSSAMRWTSSCRTDGPWSPIRRCFRPSRGSRCRRPRAARHCSGWHSTAGSPKLPTCGHLAAPFDFQGVGRRFAAPAVEEVAPVLSRSAIRTAVGVRSARAARSQRRYRPSAGSSRRRSQTSAGRMSGLPTSRTR